ncbi:MAG: T9SS type A sorting domain-containing protein [Flavobacteriales bacterium]|nr:MAG: T9SS type A sorting domain-containing protein [Flavobacteriales bacterium]
MTPSQTFRIVSSALVIHAATITSAQDTWRRSYGGTGTSVAHSVIETSDGGFLVVGSTGSFGNGSSDIYVLKLDAAGEPAWTRAIGGPGVDSGIGGGELSDGFVVAGTTTTGAFGGYDYYLAKLDFQGDLQWEQSYGGQDWDICHALDVTTDRILLGGVQYGMDSPYGSANVLSLDLSGTTTWSFSLGEPYASQCRGLTATLDDGVVLVGQIDGAGTYSDALMVKLDAQGNQVWSEQHVGDSTDVFHGIVEVPSVGYVAIGNTISQSNVQFIHLYSVDLSGQFVWEQVIGNTVDAGGAAIARAANGDLVLTGYNTLNLGARDMIFTRTEPEGWFLVGNNYGNGQPADGYCIQPTSDGGFVVAGWCEGYGPGIRSVYVVKTDSTGQTDGLDVEPYADPTTVVEHLDTGAVTTSPNPSLLGQSVWVSGFEPAHTYQVEVRDLAGRLVSRLFMRPAGDGLVLTDLPRGQYFVSVLRDGAHFGVERLIVL